MLKQIFTGMVNPKVLKEVQRAKSYNDLFQKAVVSNVDVDSNEEKECSNINTYTLLLVSKRRTCLCLIQLDGPSHCY